jgi:Fe(3+) dicitrate transport protein
MEGGNQLNISVRGLDPHRAWEFNLRKDGILYNSDLYAYPASHYSIPMESVEKIELVRGTGSLQYGAQFGGMLNYVTKQSDTTKKIAFESFNTTGSFRLLSTYNAVNGRINKLRYYAYFSKRSREGYRDNERTKYDAQGIHLEYKPFDKLTFRLEWARSNYIYQVPGPMTDAMLAENPRQATRFRNYYSPTIHVPSITIGWNINDQTRVQFVSSSVLGQRKSVIYDRPATIADTFNATTGFYNNRQVDIDRFNSYTQEIRLLHEYKIAGKVNHITSGIQIINNHLHRTQLGKGTTGMDYDLSLTDPVWGRDIHLRTFNLAVFAENSFQITHKLALNAGFRFESGQSKMGGKIVYYPENEIPVSIQRLFPLFGGGFSYKPLEYTEIYGGISQTYRPVLFKDIIPTSVFEKVDPGIKDADGFNAEFGCRGAYKFLKWDITGFFLQYTNRFGTLALTDSVGNFYTYRTNIGNAGTKGLELLLQANWSAPIGVGFTVFTSTSLMDGRYTSGTLRSGSSNQPIKGNKIESTPLFISRNGLTIQWKFLSTTLLVSHTSNSFADPLNTVLPNSTGTVGIVPGYTLTDINTSIQLTDLIEIKAGINNLANKQYFTKRPSFYPGPGIWPSDGRNGYFSFILRL